MTRTRPLVHVSNFGCRLGRREGNADAITFVRPDSLGEAQFAAAEGGTPFGGGASTTPPSMAVSPRVLRTRM